MDYKLYKLSFQNSVHFGKQNLDDGETSFCADTFYSALCQEALFMGEDILQSFHRCACDGKILLSDAFPYIKDTFFLPKPMKRIQSADKTGDSVIKKAYKKLKYIPMNLLDTYLQGEYDVLNAPDLSDFGTFKMKEAAAVRREEETLPYRIGTYSYHAGNGLYIIIGYQEQEALALLEELLKNLTFSGLGGKRASGLGRFQLFSENLPPDFCKRLNRKGKQYMSLSLALPRDNELEDALNGAEYLLCKRSGFVASDTYAPEQMRKRDLYAFRAGSCFSSRFLGDIYDVSGKGGKHPVYRYAKPILMEVDT